MMKVDVESAGALLARTPDMLRAMLMGLPSAWLDAPEKPGAWSPREVACHMADVETDGWVHRIRLILDHGAEQPLPAVPRDRFRVHYEATPLVDVLDDFERLRHANLRELESLGLDDATLATAGRHATLGPVHASQLLATWVTHDLTHLAQITRTLAAQYRDAVGPFSGFLSILRATGSLDVGGTD